MLICIVMVLCGSFVPLLFHVLLFWSKSHTFKKKPKQNKNTCIKTPRTGWLLKTIGLTGGEFSMDFFKKYDVNIEGMGRCDFSSH